MTTVQKKNRAAPEDDGGSAATLIFDEVDAGIGGAVAEAVGPADEAARRRAPGARGDPPGAGRGERGPAPARLQDDPGPGHGKHPSAISGEARVAEIARMLGGERISDTGLAHAQELLAGAGAAGPARRRQA